MNYVLDTSAAIEIAFSRKTAPFFSSILEKANWVIAPDLFIPEAANVFWKYNNFQDLPIDLCEALLDQTLALVDDFVNSRLLFQEAFALACQAGRPVYDALYLVVARRHNATLLTRDKKLVKLGKKYSIKIAAQ